MSWPQGSGAVGRPPSPPWLSRLAEWVLAYLVVVIVFGAWVRISGSGAGCGESWPSCRGALVPAGGDAKTWVELTHRLTSALSGVLVVGLAVGVFRLLPRDHAARRFALQAVGFVVLEGAIGAGLVLGGLVADNASVARAAVVAIHLVNTLLLTRAAALVGSALRHSAGSARLGLASSRAPLSGGAWSEGLSLLGLVVVAACGAVTALGDTLFPVGAEGSAVAAGHWLVSLRAVHPVLAVVVSVGVVLAVFRVGRVQPELGRLALSCAWACGLQVLLGAANVGAGAPGWMQLLHLLLAQAVWVLCVRLFYSARIPSSARFSPITVPSSSYS